MNRYAISGLVLTMGVLAGCAATSKTALDPDVEMVLPTPNVVAYVPPPTVVAGPPATATVVAVPATTTVVQAPPTGVAVVPAPVAPSTTTVVVPAPNGVPPTAADAALLRAGDITSERVRANIIYANRIDADEVQGVIHQDRNLQIGATRGDVRMPDVVASVIYADQISANSIVADHIYVRDLRRR